MNAHYIYDQVDDPGSLPGHATMARKVGVMDKDTILQYFQELNQELDRLGVIGEICLYGGAVK